MLLLTAAVAVALMARTVLGACPADLSIGGLFARNLNGLQCMGLVAYKDEFRSAYECASACSKEPACDAYQYCDPNGYPDGSGGTVCGAAEPNGYDHCGCFFGTSNQGACLRSLYKDTCLTSSPDWDDFGCTPSSKCAKFYLSCSRHPALPGGDPYDPANQGGGATPSPRAAAIGLGWLVLLVGSSATLLLLAVYAGGGAAFQAAVLKKRGAAELFAHLAVCKHM